MLRYARNGVKKLLLSLTSFLAACSVIEQPAAMIPRWTTAWREAATVNDEKRLHDWRSSFVDALAAARKSGHSSEIAAEGALLDPDAALGPPAVSNGTYRCRIIKLGAQSQGMLDYVAYPAFLLASIIAFPVAWWIMHKWLQDFAYRISISWWIFLGAGLLAVIIALATISFQAFRAAIANPVKSLRNE